MMYVISVGIDAAMMYVISVGIDAAMMYVISVGIDAAMKGSQCEAAECTLSHVDAVPHMDHVVF
jgi:hypothetical protein